APGNDLLLAYVADLELEVDRLRRQNRFIETNAVRTLTQILRLCTSPAAGEVLPTLARVEETARDLFGVVKDLHEPPGYHPSYDQVVAIAIRPLAEQVFRWQQRLTGVGSVQLRLELEADHVEWFPARLRHILDNLLAQGLRSRDPAAAESWVSVRLQAGDGVYLLGVVDNGLEPPDGIDRRSSDLFYRAAPARSAGLGAGPAVARLLAEQSGGSLTTSRRDGGGTEYLVSLPRYDLLDYL
ncbi:MAG TPA: ATP-binding protein, partial [Gemmataceae bacterium]|nr:ATP-binding protein [Gemmataceae bacterium]